MLITAGADVNQKDITGRTPLHWAVANNKYELIELLVTNDANPNPYTLTSEPILAKPILRHDKKLKNYWLNTAPNIPSPTTISMQNY